MDFQQFAFQFLSSKSGLVHHFDLEYFSRLFLKMYEDGGSVWSTDSGRRRVFRCVDDSDVIDYCSALYPTTAFPSGVHDRRVRMGLDFWDLCVEWSTSGNK